MADPALVSKLDAIISSVTELKTTVVELQSSVATIQTAFEEHKQAATVQHDKVCLGFDLLYKQLLPLQTNSDTHTLLLNNVVTR